ncbi:tRNA lysidine(34) synthetase TilS [Ekhidna sp.]|uniref:tRNA lysidine(34) synthetase TilS n=1 Tax=Ekhidna sp. TaxID=2608089 RepID=UPI003512EA1F
MHSLQKQFHDYIHSNDLVRKGEKILLAVSGGLDSMVMANLFMGEKINVSIAHCNYQLRGEESDGDEAFVMKWADQRGINCFVKSFELGDGSIQLEARNARYQWFGELIAEHKLDRIATAHHLNDSLETVLINLSRGTGIKGVSGISGKNDNVIRPLLFASKEELHSYAMDLGLEWREDSSNSKTDYDRNLIRHEVIPELKKLNPSLLRTFVSTAERLSYASQIVQRRLAEIEAQYLKKNGNGWKIELDWISDPSDELILAEMLASFGVNYATAKEVFEARGKSGKSFPVGEWFITMDRSTLFIDPDKSVSNDELMIDKEGTYNFGDSTIEISRIGKGDIQFTSNDEAYFDLSKLNFPLCIRGWKEGDRIQPLGMNGTKKVSDILIDEKVSVSQKRKVLVVESSGIISWVVGYRVSDQFKITEKTTEVLKISVK